MKGFKTSVKECFQLLDKRSIMTQMYHGLTLIVAILCFSPFIGTKYYTSNERAIILQDELKNQRFSNASAACLIIVIPSFVDLVVDLLVISYDAFFHSKSRKTLKVKPFALDGSHLFRFTMMEKFLFICGMVSFSLVIFPTRGPDSHILLINQCSLNLAPVLISVSVILFLERSTEGFTPCRVFLILFCVFIGSSMRSISFCYPLTSQTHIRVFFVGNLLMLLATIFYLITCLLCFWSYCRQKWTKRRISLYEGDADPLDSSETTMSNKTFENFVPFCHMVSFIILAIINFIARTRQNYYEGTYQYCIVAAATLIFVTEMRVRKTDLYFALMIHTHNTEKTLKREISDQHNREQELVETSFMRSELSAAHLAREKNELSLAKRRVDIQKLSLANENEKILQEAQAKQLRSLMGNVAHDLKTPIHSIVIDIEMLKNIVNKEKSSDIRDLSIIKVDTEDVFDSLESTCSLMIGGINRCLDYMKASSNIALQPAMATFNLSSAIAVATRCVTNLSSASPINTHHLSPQVCPFLISDKQWLIENVLCLLSNAVKYSGTGTVDLKIELVSELCVDNSKEESFGDNCIRKKSVLGDIELRSLDSIGDMGAMMMNDSNESACTSQKTGIVTADSSGDMDESVKNITISTQKTPQNTADFNRDIDQSVKTACNKIKETSIFNQDIDQSVKTACNKIKKTIKKRSDQSGEVYKEYIRVSVEDTGIGIATEARMSLFQPFKQAQRSAGGTGLGLYSLLKRMEALRGSCGVESRTDGKQGSVFYFSFPYRPDQSAASLECEQSVIMRSPTYTLENPSLRILLVDDSMSILKITGRSLVTNSHNVLTANNGSEGLEALKRAYFTRDFDMLLTDLQMPVMDGLEMVKRFRIFEKEQHVKELNEEFKLMIGSSDDMDEENGIGELLNTKRKLFIIGMSANSDIESRKEAISSGMDNFISKPFTYNDFQKSLDYQSMGL
mmetsp:Transcript_22374/g.21603  ORF Transcript_22374/g.21603 Transcript_22374/m.21603 type:complete len:964 (-) Transcript_22374:241-3132(-)